MTDEELIAKLQARQPKRENYPTQDEFEESLGFWRSREGRMLATLTRPKKPIQGMSEEDKAELSKAITKGFRYQNEFADRVGALEDVPTEVPEVTLQAYKDAVYRVGTQPPFFLKVDLPSPDLARVYDNFGVKTAAFLTAYNPLGHPLREEANEPRQGRLRSDLESAKLHYIDGTGCDPNGKWTGEPSFLVLGILFDQAKAFGERYQQNAILWASEDAVPRLVTLR